MNLVNSVENRYLALEVGNNQVMVGTSLQVFTVTEMPLPVLWLLSIGVHDREGCLCVGREELRSQQKPRNIEEKVRVGGSLVKWVL